MPKPKHNQALRQWARGVSFTIAMGRRQVFTLVSIHLSRENPHTAMQFGQVGSYHRLMRNFVTSANCLLDRGLINAPVWESEVKRAKLQADKNAKYGDHWHLTRAGELVIELLKEAGIYEEVEQELRKADQPRMRIA